MAMTILPLVAARRAGLSFPPRWSAPGVRRPGCLVRKGAWGAGDIGLNQVLIAATIVFAGRHDGRRHRLPDRLRVLPAAPRGARATRSSRPCSPHLAARGAAGDADGFAATSPRGCGRWSCSSLPAAALLAAVALPVLSIVEVGELDSRGASFVAAVLAAYLVGVLGYSTFFLLTRASYALDDVRSPTMVYLWVTLAAIGAMAVTSSACRRAGARRRSGAGARCRRDGGVLWAVPPAPAPPGSSGARGRCPGPRRTGHRRRRRRRLGRGDRDRLGRPTAGRRRGRPAPRWWAPGCTSWCSPCCARRRSAW